MGDIANKICKSWEHGDNAMFIAQCACSSPNHTQTLLVDVDPDLGSISLSISSTIFTKYDNKFTSNVLDTVQEWWTNKKRKYKYLVILWWTGQIEAENEFLFDSKEQIDDYISALSSARDKLYK